MPWPVDSCSGVFQAWSAPHSMPDLHLYSRRTSLFAPSPMQRSTKPTRQVPQVKRTLERFVYGVKLLLAEMDRADSFWMGALKHKDLHGNEMASQVRQRLGVGGEELAARSIPYGRA